MLQGASIRPCLDWFLSGIYIFTLLVMVLENAFPFDVPLNSYVKLLFNLAGSCLFSVIWLTQLCNDFMWFYLLLASLPKKYLLACTIKKMFDASIFSFLIFDSSGCLSGQNHISSINCESTSLFYFLSADWNFVNHCNCIV